MDIIDCPDVLPREPDALTFDEFLFFLILSDFLLDLGIGRV